MRILALAMAALLLGLGAFLRFVDGIPRPPLAPPPADAIVVLTGGPLRLAEGLRLLRDGAAPRLLLSGVNPDTSKSMLPGYADQQALFTCCVELGFAAADTTGNAVEVAQWAAAGGYRRLILVTAAWHLPRAQFQLARRLPDAQISGYPVLTDRAAFDRWWTAPGTAWLLAGEFAKYVVTLLRARLGLL